MSILLGIAIWGLIIGGVIVVVKVVLLTFEILKEKISKKLKDARVSRVVTMDAKNLMKKIIKETAENPNTTKMTSDQFMALENELIDKEGNGITAITAGISNKDEVLDDTIEIIKGKNADQAAQTTLQNDLIIEKTA